MPHPGHVLTRVMKDVFLRYRTMCGYHVPRRAGWDTHGLPVEVEVEKELGISGREAIQEYGVEAFSRKCIDSVFKYIGEWRKMTRRIGFWVDFDSAYVTFHKSYVESVWWALSEMFKKGLLYQGYKVVWWWPQGGTALSAGEVGQGYQTIDDPSVMIRFPVKAEDNTSFLAWTTTPWTLPSNIALAVDPDTDYATVEIEGGERLILAAALVGKVLGDDAKVVRTRKGSELVGMSYEPPFRYAEPEGGPAWQVVDADFVSLDSGSGLVHLAPAFGEDDFRICKEKGMGFLQLLKPDGTFPDEVTDFAGRFCKEADRDIIRNLRARRVLLKEEVYRHDYPFCWRAMQDPLIQYARRSWFIRTTQEIERVKENNQDVHWEPEHIKSGRMGQFLEGNVDWALSRERFWGTPLPIWKNDETGAEESVGSVPEILERNPDAFAHFEKAKAADPTLQDHLMVHKPWIDDVTWTKDGEPGVYRRVPEVIDCWFDSGAMSYAQWHYPFENQEIFEEHFPADYICEAIDQTRGWFYTLHAIATLVSDSVAFRNCVCLAHIVDKDGKKMSKSLGNIVDPYDVFDTVGADALRWYLAARIAPEVQKRISVELVREVASTFINTLWNTYGFFVLYARLDAVDLSKDVALEKRPEIDRWILALLHHTTDTVTEAMERYDARAAGEAIESFVDQLSNWYVRRNRRRFWKAAAGEDKQAAYLTLYECLHVVHRLMAPLMPFLSEAMYQNLVRAVDAGAPMSVHMADWPVADAAKRNRALIEQFDVVQRVVGLGRAARNDTRLRVRQPLARLLVRVPDEAAAAAVQAHREQILEELNVKSLELVAADAALVSYRLKPNLPRIGKRYGKRIPAIRAALAEADAARIASSATAGQGFELDVDGETIAFEAEDVLVESVAAEGYACAEEGGYLVGLDTRLDDALLEEGLARELVRTIQEARKQAGLEVSDRIVLRVTGSDAVEAAVATHRDFLMDETLASSWGEDGFDPSYATEHSLDDNRWKIELKRAA